MQVQVLPVLNDNYIFIILHPQTKTACVVDPAQADPVVKWLDEHGYRLDCIINTHHHMDHIGGNAQLKKRYQCPVYCSQYDKNRIPTHDHTLKEGDVFKWHEFEANILEAKGHTLGHILYYFKNQKVLFCGDTLFAMGCGYLFEGSPEQMYQSLQKIASLPDDTVIYCTHEYTQKNAEFALTVDSENEDLLKRYDEVVELRENNKFTIPTNVKIEKLTNPFLRCHTEAIKIFTNTQNASDAVTFSKVRELKNNF